MNLQYNAEADEHILVCLSSAPSNSKIIRTAAKWLMPSVETLPRFI